MAIIIERYCDKCRKIYDYETNSTECPHQGFPRAEECERHLRKHCGHPECQAKSKPKPNLVNMSQRKDVISKR